MTDDCLTLEVAEAGRKYLGMSRWSSYEAARKGIIPTIKVGQRLRVPKHLMEAMIGRGEKTAA